jgi:putative sigma-54 modulation protein
MQITITARHFDLTKAIREHVEEACEKLVKYFDQIINLHLTLSLEHGRNTVEVQLHASHFSLTSEDEQHDMYLAIDNAIEKMESQIKKLKDRVTDHQKKRLKDDLHISYANLLERTPPSGATRKVVKTKRIVAESMTINEAIDRFEEIADPYLIFMNVETDRINVLVKKDEEHYRLIEP